jgi:hypothetical protein
LTLLEPYFEITSVWSVSNTIVSEPLLVYVASVDPLRSWEHAPSGAVTLIWILVSSSDVTPDELVAPTAATAQVLLVVRSRTVWSRVSQPPILVPVSVATSFGPRPTGSS